MDEQVLILRLGKARAMTDWPDAVNSGFTFVGALAIWLDCWRVYKDKDVRGVSRIAALFMGIWSWWHLWYMAHLDQWASFVAVIPTVAADCFGLG